MKTWPKGTKCICCWFNCPRFAARPAIPKAQRWSKKLFWRQCYTNVKPVLPHNLKHIILHVGTNNALTLPPNLILDKTLESKIKIEETNKDCKVTILTSTYRFDNRKPGNTVSELANMLINLNVSIVNNIVRRKHLGYKGVHLNSYGSSRLAMNLISIIKKMWNDASYPTNSLEYKYIGSQNNKPEC